MFKRFRRTGRDGDLRALQALVPQINALEPEMERYDDDALRGTRGELRSRLDRGEDLDDLMVEAFAVVREASRRVLGERHYDVQLLGGAALHLGLIAEMKTGEGKTLASTLPAYLNSLAGQGVHVVTTNEYLATRDAEWMGRLHRRLGLRVGLLTPDQPDRDHRRQQYAADITYGTSEDFGYDYLRDNLVEDQRHKVQRGHNFVVVDEADSLLIDRARTTLTLANKVADASERYHMLASVAERLQRDIHYEVDEDQHAVAPTDEGVEEAELAVGVDNLYEGGPDNLARHLQLALEAKELYRRDRDYVVQDGVVKIIDEHTGHIRDAPWSGGLHQAVEAKEDVKIREESLTIAEVTRRNYVRLYDKLAGMTGTATSDAVELRDTYGVPVVAIPTNKPVARVDRLDLIYRTEEAKLDGVVADIAARHQAGQPVLVATVSVGKSEKLARRLDDEDIPHEVLNAKEDFEEADVIAQAGRLHAVTVVTGMAGRGVDIVLGGNPEGLAKRDLRARGLDPDGPANTQELREALERYEPETASDRDKVWDLGGLCVIGTERHDNRRIDDQLRGRAGRQGEPGESRFYVSLDDDLMRVIAIGFASRAMGNSDQPLENKMPAKSVERAQVSLEQRRAGQRKQGFAYDEVDDEQRKVIYALRDQVLETRRQLRELAEAGGEGDPHQVPSGLRPKILDEYLPDAVDRLVESHAGTYGDEGDLETLRVAIQSCWPSTLTTEDLASAGGRDVLYEQLTDEAVDHYERRETELTARVMRGVECQFMLRAIDRHWPTLIREMYHLREGISWRKVARTDPLQAWRQEGFEMFSKMMQAISEDVISNVMLAKVDVKKART